jgi:hypothetical protein
LIAPHRHTTVIAIPLCDYRPQTGHVFLETSAIRDPPPSPHVTPPIEPPPASNTMSCTCSPYTCDCRKDCFCRIRTTPYGGSRLVPPPGLGALTSRNGKAVHACECDLAMVGGNGLQAGNTVDCECATAQCGCTRKCTCKAPAPV